MPTVRLDVDARGVATITLARPEKKNAFDAALIAELTATARAIDAGARCAVLRAEGDTFCAGADLTWMGGLVGASREANLADARDLAAMYAALDAIPVPLVARVQGSAFGGGAGLVAVADIAIASRDAVFGFTEVRVGILPAVVSPYVVRKIGVANATAAFTSGVRFDAARANAMGLVQSVESPDGLDHAVEHFVEAVLAGSPDAVRQAKRLVRDVAGHVPAEVRELTVERIADIRVSPDGQEGMRAFLERRPPRWRA